MTKLSLIEISRRLFKKGWADNKEYKQALDAMERLSTKEQRSVIEHAERNYGLNVTQFFNKG